MANAGDSTTHLPSTPVVVVKSGRGGSARTRATGVAKRKQQRLSYHRERMTCCYHSWAPLTLSSVSLTLTIIPDDIDCVWARTGDLLSATPPFIRSIMCPTTPPSTVYYCAVRKHRTVLRTTYAHAIVIAFNNISYTLS